MDPKAMFKITYGLFVLTARVGEKMNGCIINTACQLTTEPNRVSIAVNRANYTEEMIRESGVFNLSIISEEASFDLFTHFGFQSGRDVDKFDGFADCRLTDNGIPIITKGTNAYLSCTVEQMIDLGSHTLFIARVDDVDGLSDVASASYAYYQASIKPKPQQAAAPSGKKVWRCSICNYVYDPEKGDPDNGIAPGTAFADLPDDWVCPLCKHPKSDFEEVDA